MNRHTVYRRNKLMWLVAFAMLTFFSVTVYTMRFRVIYEYRMISVRQHITEQDSGWASVSMHEIESISNGMDSIKFSNYLLGETDPNLIAEGLLIACRNHHPDIKKIANSRLGDTRDTWYLRTLDELARDILMVIDSICQNKIDPNIEKIMDYWNISLQPEH